MIIEYVRMRSQAGPPQRANPSDAGLDLFFNPEPNGFLVSEKIDAVEVKTAES